MKLPGYCTKCHKIKRVNVTGQGLALLSIRGVPQGICDDCEAKP